MGVLVSGRWNTIFAGVGGIAAVASAYVAWLTFQSDRPLPRTAEMSVAEGKGENVDLVGKMQAPSAPAPATPMPGKPATPAPPTLSVASKSVDIGINQRLGQAMIQLKLSNQGEKPLAITWLRPGDNLALVVGATKFSSRPSRRPTGVSYCQTDNGELCWERYSQSFTTVPPGDSVVALIELYADLEATTRQALVGKQDGLLSGVLYVVEPGGGMQRRQQISLEVGVNNAITP